MSNGSEVMIYLSFLLSEFIATRRARLEAREAGFLVYIKCTYCKKFKFTGNTVLDLFELLANKNSQQIF